MREFSIHIESLRISLSLPVKASEIMANQRIFLSTREALNFEVEC